MSRVLFKIQTSGHWQNVVLSASFLHALLVVYEGLPCLPPLVFCCLKRHTNCTVYMICQCVTCV